MATNPMHRLSAYKSFNPLHLLYVIYRMMVKALLLMIMLISIV